jgi:hypothetical protein
VTTWAPLAFDPAAPRFDPPGVSPPRDSRIRTICRSIDKLLSADSKEWRARFAKYFGYDRRRDRREAITLALKAAVTRTDFLTGNTYLDRPKSDKGCSIAWYAERTLCAPDRIKEAISDLKTAQLERFDRCPVAIEKGKLAGKTIVRRLPKAQPRSEENGHWTAEPAIRNFDWKQIGLVFRCSGSIKLLKTAAQKRRDREGREPPGQRQKLMEARRAANRKRWTESLKKRRLAGPEQIGLTMGGLYGDLTRRATGAIPTPEQPPVPAEILLAVQMEDARRAIIDEWKAANQRAGGKLPLPTEAEADAEIRRRVGLPPRRLE